MALDYPTNNCQPDSRAFEIFSAMQPLENLKELVHVLHVEAHAIVTDENR